MIFTGHCQIQSNLSWTATGLQNNRTRTLTGSPINPIWTRFGPPLVFKLSTTVSSFQITFYQFLLIVHIIGASSLYAACEPLVYSFKRRPPSYTWIEFFHKDSLKNLSFLLSPGALRNNSDIVLWHDLIVNTISPYYSNHKKTLDHGTRKQQKPDCSCRLL